MLSRSLRVVRATARAAKPRLRRRLVSRCLLSTRTSTSADPFADLLLGHDEVDSAKEVEELRKKEIREELDNKKGRGWTDPWDLEDMMESREKFDDLPDWQPSLVSRISQERVQLHPDKIPVLQTLAELPLPPPPPPHPGQGHAKAYALLRKRAQYKYVRQQVELLAEPKIGAIQQLSDWHDKQDAVDELFEEIEFQLKDAEPILGVHPSFSAWVERALEGYLRSIQKENNQGEGATAEGDTSSDKDADALPIFMDCYGSEDSEEIVVPKVLAPLQVNERGTNGNMVEEWELSAHQTSKRIMLRQCTRAVARALVESSQPPRILLSGQQGVGKTAAVAAIVASARTTGYIVLYIPDGDQLHQNGFYIEPNQVKPGIFDLPILSQHVSTNLLKSHEKDLVSFVVDKAVLQKHFSSDQLERLLQGDSDEISLVDLLKFGLEHVSYAGSCYASAMECLMDQEEKPFLIVMDEFNCFFKRGQYFHADYDETVKNPIPYDQISLFKPALDAMALATDDEGSLIGSAAGESSSSKMMKKGGLLVATTESHAVPRAVTDTLVANAKEIASGETEQTTPLVHCEVPRLSPLEVEHMLANYEATGVGRLRMDQGETVMNDQEVAFLRMVSGGVAQKLMDACIL